MSIEIRKNNFAVSYENTFFRLVAKAFKELLETKEIEGFFSGSPVCTATENLQLDSILITKTHAIIIDFKNYGGTITLPKENFEEEAWLHNDSNIVKGGSGDKNPFAQLTWQKKAFTWCYHNYIASKIAKEDEFNPFDVKTVVCFQQKVKIEGAIPSKFEKHFFICDNTTLIDTIRDIIETNVIKYGINPIINLSVDSFNAFKSIFKADLFDLNSVTIGEEKEQSLDNYDARINIENDKLNDDKVNALNKFREFLRSENQIFILQGAIDSGKTQLIPNLQEVIFSEKYNECELIAQSNRIVRSLESEYGLEGVSSLYKSIYGGIFYDENEQVEDESEKPNSTSFNDIIPLKKCQNHEKTVFIITEAHLLSDNYYTINGTLFGSGQVISDLVKHIDFMNSRRKLVFIGDPFLIGDSKNSPLSSSFLKEKFNLDSDSYLLKSTSKTAVNKEALKIADYIRNKKFNELSINLNEQITTITQDSLKSVVEKFSPDYNNLRFITYNHGVANSTNLWLKNNFLKNGSTINSGDLVLFYNSINIPNQNDPLASPRQIANGDYTQILEIGNLYSKNIDQLPALKFRKFKGKHLISGQIFESILFENFLISPKAEITSDEIIAFNIFLKKIIDGHKLKYNELDGLTFYDREAYREEEVKLNIEIVDLKKKKEEGDTVKTLLEKKEQNLRGLKRKYKIVKKLENKIKYDLKEDINSDYFKYSNVSWLRFGWAVNVYKSKSFKWENVIVEANPNEIGKGEMLFRHLYTSLISSDKIILKDFQRITPFDKIIWNDYMSDSKGERKKIFHFDHEIEIDDTLKSKINTFQFPAEKPELKIFFANVSKKLAKYKIEIQNVVHSGKYSEEYHFSKDPEKAKIIISYNDKFEYKLNTISYSTTKEFAEDIIENLYSLTDESIDVINPSSLIMVLKKRITEILENTDIKIKKSESKKYCEVYSFGRQLELVTLNISYDGNGFFTTILCQSSNSDSLLAEAKKLILKLKEN